jgi:hypothetical protein
MRLGRARGSVASGPMQSVPTSRPRAVECACVRCVCVCAPLPRVDCGRVCVAHESVRKHRDPPAALLLRTNISATTRLCVWNATSDCRAWRAPVRAKAPTSACVECTCSRPRALTGSRVVWSGARVCTWVGMCCDCIWMAAAAKRARTQRAGCDGLWVAPWQRTRARVAHPPLALPASRATLRVTGPHKRAASPQHRRAVPATRQTLVTYVGAPRRVGA